MVRPDWFQLDVFAARPGDGNPLGVVVGARGWNGERMQRFAAWTGLVETTFVLPPDQPQADYRVRIFTPHREIPFAGHPSIGSAHAAIESGWADPSRGRLVQECGAGQLPIDIDIATGRRRLFVQAPGAAPVAHEIEDERTLLALLGDLPLGPLPPVLMAGGRRWWLAEVASEAALRHWRPEVAAIAALARGSDALGLCLFARSGTGEYDLCVRAFPCAIGIDEDPASGAANSLLAAWIARREPGGPLAHGFSVSQGREIGRDARLELRIGAGGRIAVGGEVQTVISGHLHWDGG